MLTEPSGTPNYVAPEVRQPCELVRESVQPMTYPYSRVDPVQQTLQREDGRYLGLRSHLICTQHAGV